MGLSQYTRNATIGVKSKYFATGFKGLLEVQNCKLTSEENMSGSGFAIELKVLESNKAEDPVGSVRSHYIPLSSAKYKDSAAGDILQILGVLVGFDPNDTDSIEFYVTDEMQDAATDSRNVMRGRHVALEVLPPKPGKTYTKKMFMPVLEQPENVTDLTGFYPAQS